MTAPVNNYQRNIAIPALLGVGVGLLLYNIYHWWGFFIVFPWIGL
jgi:hypothetical protein